MCGIFAWVSRSDPLPDAALAAAVRVLTHRGPDGSRVWVDPSGRAGLGHTRLAVQDLRFGSQPMCNEDGSLHLVANGELYGFEEIARGLSQRGHRIATRSDSEIILHLYEDLYLD
ncbi:MAG: asparagine synthase (glutamine-hydrolyzing), partial [Gammaproteobacteria bacterium]